MGFVDDVNDLTGRELTRAVLKACATKHYPSILGGHTSDTLTIKDEPSVVAMGETVEEQEEMMNLWNAMVQSTCDCCLVDRDKSSQP